MTHKIDIERKHGKNLMLCTKDGSSTYYCIKCNHKGHDGGCNEQGMNEVAKGKERIGLLPCPSCENHSIFKNDQP
jgi:hypothetical protein